ncbi:hypothetical protein Tco_0823186 [Tanacetum coccineum]|uniref:Reverse transcriptase n=1 Tax=Tanacetum coccineum TaxID=301880 RepID=A0ABQ5AK77_9ASTR
MITTLDSCLYYTATISIDLLPFDLGSFNVIVVMDWLSKLRAEIVCHERIIHIPLPNIDVLEVHGERSEENLKHLASMKAGSQYFSKIDLQSGYHQSRVHEEDVRRSTFPWTCSQHEGINVDSNKIEALKNWKAPSTPSILRINRKKHGRMMLDSIDNGPLVYPTVEENEQTRPKKYSELTEAQQVQDDCDVQETNFILHGLPPDVYALVNHQQAAKDI